MSVLLKRERVGRSLSELSRLTGLSISYISDIEHGRRNLSLESAWLIAEALDQWPGPWLEEALNGQLSRAGITAFRATVHT